MNNISEAITQSAPSSNGIISSNSLSSNSTSAGFFDSLKSINVTTWILIILILAFLGFNIFAYLAKGTQSFADVFAPLLKKIIGTSAYITGQAVDVSAEGAKAVVGGTASAITTGLTAVQDITPNQAGTSVKGQPLGATPNEYDQSTLNKTLQSQSPQEPEQNYQANEASSSVHHAGKSGWCYIGDDRGFRSCAEVGVNDTCMSGDIFPSQDICMNPNLRT
jgi:hypothetical protein